MAVHQFLQMTGCPDDEYGVSALVRVVKKNTKIGHRARPRRASATAPLRTGADIFLLLLSSFCFFFFGICVVVRLGPPATHPGLCWIRGFSR